MNDPSTPPGACEYYLRDFVGKGILAAPPLYKDPVEARKMREVMDPVPMPAFIMDRRPDGKSMADLEVSRIPSSGWNDPVVFWNLFLLVVFGYVLHKLSDVGMIVFIPGAIIVSASCSSRRAATRRWSCRMLLLHCKIPHPWSPWRDS